MNANAVSQWLGDFYLLATVLLVGAFAACRLATQPARRIALAWAATGGLFALIVLTAIPNWSRVHLRSPAPPTIAPQEYLQPVVGDAIQRNMGLPPRIPEGSPLPPPPLEAEAVPLRLVIDWAVLALSSIGIGSAIVVGWLALGAWQVWRLRRVAEPAPERIQALLGDLTPAGMPVPMLGVLDKLPVAVAVGLRNPVILLPRSLVDQPRPEQLRAVLAHELAHIQHRDLWLLAVLRVLLVLLWVHPLFWLWRRKVRLDQEVLADMAAADLSNRSDYAEELVELARSATVSRVPRLASSVGLWETRSQPKQRLALLLDERLIILRSCTKRWRVASLVVLLGLAGGLSLVTLSPAELQGDAETSHEAVKGADSGINASEKNVASSPKDTEVEESQNDISSALSPETFLIETNETFKQLYKARKPNTITGLCVDEKGEPLANAKVEVYSGPLRDPDTEPQKILSTTTDSEGKYEFEEVIDIEKEFPEGLPDSSSVLPDDTTVITVISREPGRVPGFVGNNVSSGVARNGEVYLHRMVPAESLRGRIVDEYGQPVFGARVKAGLLANIRGIPADLNSAETDDNGEYSINDLEPYDVEQEKKKFEEMQEADGLNWQLYAGNDRKPWARWLWVRHPDFAMKRAAIENIPGRVDVELQPGAVLTGRVVTQEEGKSPEPARNVEVRLQREMSPDGGNEFNYQTKGTRTDDEGKYRFDSLPAGKYACMPQTAGWVSQGVDGIELKQGKSAQAPDLVMTRGGQVRVQLIDDATGEPMTFEKPTKGYVVLQPRPRKLSFSITPNTTIVEFSAEGVGEQQLPEGKYRLFVSLPGDDGGPGWQSVDAARIKSPEDMDKMPVYEVKEGEVLNIYLRMQKEQPQVMNGTVKLSMPPSDGEKQEKSQQNNEKVEFTPAKTPADGEEKDAYEKGIFVPSVPVRK